MAFCGKCGSQLHENATFCANCGSAVGGAAQTPVAAAPVVTPPAAAPVVPLHLEESKGFFGSLFDISFSSFVTSKIVKFLYVLIIILLVIGAIALIATVLGGGSYGLNLPFPAPVAVIVIAILFFLYLILARVQLEIIVVIFRMSEHLAEIAEQGRRR
ncbi:MAG TPA: DUF4282 domain-containing protein [Candidatus Angelobacter sp.]